MKTRWWKAVAVLASVALVVWVVLPTKPIDLTSPAADVGQPITLRALASEEGGPVRCAIFDSAESFKARENAVAVGVADWNGADWTFVTPPIAGGVYVAAIYRDANDNGTLDYHPLGYPTEPYAFSNNAKGSFGPPSFDSASFTHGDMPTTLSIVLD